MSPDHLAIAYKQLHMCKAMTLGVSHASPSKTLCHQESQESDKEITRLHLLILQPLLREHLLAVDEVSLDLQCYKVQGQQTADNKNLKFLPEMPSNADPASPAPKHACISLDFGKGKPCAADALVRRCIKLPVKAGGATAAD